jgi:predicted secreted protein
MKITSIIAIYFVTWWLCLFMVLPWGIRNASETGDRVERGNEPGAPVNPRIGRKMIYTTLLASIIFGIFYAAYTGDWPVLDYLPGPNAPS